MFYLFKKLRTPCDEVNNQEFVYSVWLVDSNENKDKLCETPNKYFSKSIDEWMYVESTLDFKNERLFKITDFEKKFTKWIPE